MADAKKLDLTWNVLIYDFNTLQPKTYNIFDNRDIYEDTIKLLSICTSREEFKEEFRKILQCQFWSRCEYEMILSSWPESERDKKYKLDVYEQCMLNFNRLVDYVWPGTITWHTF